MARELPIHNGRLTTDLDADGHRIKNLPGGTETVSWDNVTGKPTFATVATSGSYNDLTDKPTIPEPVAIDPALSPTSENPVQNKAVTKALYTGFTEWECDSISDGWTFVSCKFKTIAQIGTGWFATVNNGFNDAYLFMGTDRDAVALTKGASSDYPALSLSRNLITPTKTSQLTNDGAPDGGGTPYATTAQIPYALVTPGEWKFSDGESYVILGPSEDPDGWCYDINTQSTHYFSQYFSTNADALASLSLAFTSDGVSTAFTATRASLPGHLLDRANNLIDATTGNVTLTLPPFKEGKVRDLLVACTIGLDANDEPWSVIFQGQRSEAPSGADEISFKAEGDDAESATFPVPAAAGDWWYSLTERAPHVFAVSLKQLQSVSQPTQTQGGS